MATTPKNLLDVLKPIGRAKGLPNEHYIDNEIFLQERESLLFKQWSGIGFAKDVPNAGDVNPIEFMNTPLLIVRDDKNKIRVFQNTCRHRGMILINGKKNLQGVIRCPYHSWCYDLTGQLRSTPHVGGPGVNIHKDVKKSELGLVEFNCYVWLGIIFVNISNDAKSFETHHADLIKRWIDFEKPLYHSGKDSSIRLEVKCNWKLAVENYCESYHLPWVHPGLNSYSRLEDHYNIERRTKFAGQGSTVYRQLNVAGKTFPSFEQLGQKWKTGAEYLAVFPNVLLGVHLDHIFAIILEPISTDLTIEHIEIYYSSQKSLRRPYSLLRRRNKEQWEIVFLEDIPVVEGMQKGRLGKNFDGGKFSPVMDGPTHLFHDWVAGSFRPTKDKN